MKHRYSILCLLAPLAVLTACSKHDAPGAPAAAAQPAESVATVNGKPISKSEFDMYVANIARQSGREVPADQRSQMLDQFIGMKLAADKAEKDGIAKDAKVEDQLSL